VAVALGEGDVKSVEDLAGLIPDDLRGWFETKDGERTREAGILDSFNLSPEDAEALIMRARIVMGWVEAPPEPEYVERTSSSRKRRARSRPKPRTRPSLLKKPKPRRSGRRD
jgi:N utilization substance protein A